MLIVDVEVYSNYFLIAFKQIETGKIRTFEMYDGHPLDTVMVMGTMCNHTTISFNGLSFDLPIIQAALEGWNNQALKSMSNSIIKSNQPSWKFCKTNNINVDLGAWNHIDLIDIAPGKSSLKLYGGRMSAATIQDLPFDEKKELSRQEMEIVKDYCINDLDTTELLYNTLKPAIDLRIEMSKQYGIDLRSKSDAQIAETIIKSELTKITGKQYKPIVLKDGATIRYQDPGIVDFKSEALKEIFETVLEHEFELLGNGSIKNPEFLKKNKIKIGEAEYQMGIGGLHSCEKSQFVEADDNYFLVEVDCVSYYPNIILQQQISPKAMGTDFLELYQSIVSSRVAAKERATQLKKRISELECKLENMS